MALLKTSAGMQPARPALHTAQPLTPPRHDCSTACARPASPERMAQRARRARLVRTRRRRGVLSVRDAPRRAARRRRAAPSLRIARATPGTQGVCWWKIKTRARLVRGIRLSQRRARRRV